MSEAVLVHGATRILATETPHELARPRHEVDLVLLILIHTVDRVPGTTDPYVFARIGPPEVVDGLVEELEVLRRDQAVLDLWEAVHIDQLPERREPELLAGDHGDLGTRRDARKPDAAVVVSRRIVAAMHR